MAGDEGLQAVLDWLRANALAGTSGPSLTRDAKLLEDHQLDSIQILELVDFIEEKFSIQVAVEELVPENFETASHVAALVGRLQEA